jgi:hypothetical protein
MPAAETVLPSFYDMMEKRQIYQLSNQDAGENPMLLTVPIPAIS